MSSANKTMRLMYSSKRFCASSVAQLAYNANTIFAESSLTSIIYGVTMKLSHLAKALLVSSVLLSSVNALAAEPITVSGSAAFTSDYLFRGISQTGNNAAVQAGMTATHESGAYFSVWGSSVGFTDLPTYDTTTGLVIDGATGDGGLEIDALLGFSGKSGEVTYDIGVMHYGYPSADAALGYDEFYGSISTMGAKVGFNYSPDYFAQTEKYMYLYAGYSTTVGAVTLSGNIGLNKFDSDAAFSKFMVATTTDDSYMDYKLAASTTALGVTVEGAYIGSDVDDAICPSACEGRFVLTVSKGF